MGPHRHGRVARHNSRGDAIRRADPECGSLSSSVSPTGLSRWRRALDRLAGSRKRARNVAPGCRSPRNVQDIALPRLTSDGGSAPTKGRRGPSVFAAPRTTQCDSTDPAPDELCCSFKSSAALQRGDQHGHGCRRVGPPHRVLDKPNRRTLGRIRMFSIWKLVGTFLSA